MKALKQWAFALTVDGIYAALFYLWQIKGVEGAGNILMTFLWLIVPLGFLAGFCLSKAPLEKLRQPSRRRARRRSSGTGGTMKTNVKPGDLAIVVGGNYPENIGKIVHVIEAFDSTRPHDGVFWDVPQNEPVWLVESCGAPLISNTDSGRRQRTHFRMPGRDRNLRALRDDEIQDEAETTR